MAKFVTLYSGSSGNCSLVSDGGTTLLVDMGSSCKKTLAALYALGYAASDISGILVTHEHSDHVSGLMTFLKHYSVPLYGAPRTLAYLTANRLVPDNAETVPLECGRAYTAGGVAFSCFGTSHDSVDCVGYRFEFAGGSLAVATDLGFVSDGVLAALTGCRVVALESNYDDARLLSGPYPYYLKNRIRSISGHLSNAECALCAAELARHGTRTLVLMHLSAENNEPELALTCCLGALENAGVDTEQIDVEVAPRYTAGRIFEV